MWPAAGGVWKPFALALNQLCSRQAQEPGVRGQARRMAGEETATLAGMLGHTMHFVLRFRYGLGTSRRKGG